MTGYQEVNKSVAFTYNAIVPLHITAICVNVT